MGADVAQQLGALLNKSAASASDINDILDSLDVSGLVILSSDFTETYTKLAQDSATIVLANLGIKESSQLFDVVNAQAVEWAKSKAAEMVGKKYNASGVLVDNPDSKWNILDATRTKLRETVTQAMNDGWGNQEIAASIKESGAFSNVRAMMIARTESAAASTHGNIIGYKATGTEKIEWLTAPECCDACDELNGVVITLGDSFGEVDAPPLHPNCRCDILPVIESEG